MDETKGPSAISLKLTALQFGSLTEAQQKFYNGHLMEAIYPFVEILPSQNYETKFRYSKTFPASDNPEDTFVISDSDILAVMKMVREAD